MKGVFHTLTVVKSFLLVSFVALQVQPGWAHSITAVRAEASFERDGSYAFGLHLSLAGSPDPAQNDANPPEQVALDYLREAIELQIDSEPLAVVFSPPKLTTQENPLPGLDDLTEVFSEVRGKVPSGARDFRVKLSPDTEVALVMIVVKDGQAQRRAQTVFAGEISRPVDLSFIGQAVIDGNPFEAEELASRPPPTFLDGLRGGLGSVFAAGARGALVVLALLFLSRSYWQAAYQAVVFWIGAFAGHYLMMSAHQAARPSLVSSLMGVSLISICLDNVLRDKVDWLRYLVLAVVGLLVGMAERRVEFERTLPALMGFYEGSLLVLLFLATLFWLVMSPFWSQSWYRKSLIAPASALLCGVGVFWIVSAFWGSLGE